MAGISKLLCKSLVLVLLGKKQTLSSEKFYLSSTLKLTSNHAFLINVIFYIIQI